MTADFYLLYKPPYRPERLCDTELYALKAGTLEEAKREITELDTSLCAIVNICDSHGFIKSWYEPEKGTWRDVDDCGRPIRKEEHKHDN